MYIFSVNQVPRERLRGHSVRHVRNNNNINKDYEVQKKGIFVKFPFFPLKSLNHVKKILCLFFRFIYIITLANKLEIL